MNITFGDMIEKITHQCPGAAQRSGGHGGKDKVDDKFPRKVGAAAQLVQALRDEVARAHLQHRRLLGCAEGYDVQL